jgi:hypothetical protein
MPGQHWPKNCLAGKPNATLRICAPMPGAGNPKIQTDIRRLESFEKVKNTAGN